MQNRVRSGAFLSRRERWPGPRVAPNARPRINSAGSEREAGKVGVPETSGDSPAPMLRMGPLPSGGGGRRGSLTLWRRTARRPFWQFAPLCYIPSSKGGRIGRPLCLRHDLSRPPRR